MASSVTVPEAPSREDGVRAGVGARRGLTVGAVLIALAMVVPALTRVDVKAGTAPPLLGDWAWRAGWSSLVVLALVALTTWRGLLSALDRLTWRRLLALSWVTSVVWMIALALVDGPSGLGRVLDHGTEYLQSARAIDDVGAMLRDYIARIPLDSPGNWPVHLAGLIVVVVAATAPAAVAVTLDRLGARHAARQALPFLVIGPAAILMAVSADAVFAATGAWAAAALAGATAARGPWGRYALALSAGMLFGWCLMQSYGLVLLGPVALAVLFSANGAGRARGQVAVVAGATAGGVVVAFAAAGFAWWQAYPALQERYWAGLASQRPGWYWVGGNLAALVLVAGPMLPAALGSGASHLTGLLRRRRPEPVAALVGAGLTMVAVADLSLMSKAEVERIWLPFLPWLMLSVVWLPERWRRWGLFAQAVTALLLQHVVRTVW